MPVLPFSTPPYKLVPSGWIPDANAWTYVASVAGSPHTWQMSTPDSASVVSTYLGAGNKYLLSQLGVQEYFVVTGLSNNGSVSTVTLYGGQNYSLASVGAITSTYFSYSKSPLGFNTDPLIWSEVYDPGSTLKLIANSPANGTYHYDGTYTVTVPIGSFSVEFSAVYFASTCTTGIVQLGAALSTAQNSFSDGDLAGWDYRYYATTAHDIATLSRRKDVTVAVGTQYFLVAYISWNGATAPASINWNFNTPPGATRLVARCNYV